jgi:AcrR family transcriptional regulator
MGITERKQRDFERRERDILDAALPLLDTDDWQSVTVERIAEQAEIGKGTIYKHFDSKDEIYCRLALDFDTILLDNLRAIDPDLEVVERLRATIRVIFQTHREHAAYHRIVEYCNREDFRRRIAGRIADRFAAVEAELTKIYSGVMKDGVDQGLFPHMPIPRLRRGPRAAVNGAIQRLWHGSLHAREVDEYLHDVTEFIIAGLLNRGAPAREP